MLLPRRLVKPHGPHRVSAGVVTPFTSRGGRRLVLPALQSSINRVLPQGLSLQGLITGHRACELMATHVQAGQPLAPFAAFAPLDSTTPRSLNKGLGQCLPARP